MPIPHKYHYASKQFTKVLNTLDGLKGKTVEWVIDHLIPVFTGENRLQKEILRIENNTLSTTAPNSITSFVTVQTNETLSAPVPAYDRGDFEADTSLVRVKYVGECPTRDISVIFSGYLSSDSVTNSNRVGMRIADDTGEVYTGSFKIFPAGTSSGTDSTSIGFTVIGYGQLTQDGYVDLQVSKNFNGTLIIENLIVSIEPLL